MFVLLCVVMSYMSIHHDRSTCERAHAKDPWRACVKTVAWCIQSVILSRRYVEYVENGEFVCQSLRCLEEHTVSHCHSNKMEHIKVKLTRTCIRVEVRRVVADRKSTRLNSSH